MQHLVLCSNLESHQKHITDSYIGVELSKKSKLASFATNQSTTGTAVLAKLQRQCTRLLLSYFSWFSQPPQCRLRFHRRPTWMPVTHINELLKLYNI